MSYLGFCPPGVIFPYAAATPPAGWLLCDGAAVSRTTYAALFAIISGSWGTGDGSTTFHLPDFRGRFLRGVDGAAGRDPNSGTRTASNSGGNTGNAVGSTQANATAVNGLANASSALTATAAAQAWTYGAASGTAAAQAWTYGAASGTAAAQAWTYGAASGTAAGQTYTAAAVALASGLATTIDLSHTHAANTFATSVGISGSAPSLSNNSVAAATHYHLGTSGISDQTYLVRPNGGVVISTQQVASGGGNSYATGTINVSYTGTPEGAAAVVGISGGSYALTGSNAVTGVSAGASVSMNHTHPVTGTTSINHTHASSSVTGVTGTNATSAVTGVTGTNATSAVTGVTGTNATSSVSGTAAAQALSGDAETRPLNANVNYIIKT